MNKLNLCTSFINLAGTTVLLNSLLSMPAWGANLKVGDSINFDVIVRNQQIGKVDITVAEKTNQPDQGRQAITGGFNVTNQQTLGQLVSSLNSQYNLGLDHFNWFQIAEFYPPIPLPNTINPFIDPPKGGLGKQWADDRPWYYDEYTPTSVPPGKIFNATNQLSAKGPNTSQKLGYLDSPIDRVTPNATFKFHTFLIGDFGNKTYDTLGGFEWSAGMQNGLTQITSLKAGTTFTNQYANLIEKQFGYKKVDILPTYLYSSTLSPGKVDNFTKSGLEASAPFIAWTNNFPGVNPTKKPDTILGAFDQSGKVKTVNDDGGPFGSNWGSGIRTAVNSDGSVKLKVTGYKDFNFDGLNDSSGGPCNGGSGGGGCLPNSPHPQAGKYDLAVKLYQDFLPLSPNVVVASASSTSRNARAFAANSVSGDESSLVSDAVYAATLLSDVQPAKKESSINAKNPDDDALPAEAVPEPTTGLGAFLGLGGLGLLKKLKNRKTQK
ncbi:MAG: PEP-CTERM sorting domain-containing protein [Microcoleus sp. PH2017_10_PVI_O_A]|uniref:PEP-CTERM sorting domain-containing protein n=1 Tax=unclassified Microcoleus TaxID=2642155 RepID=UPI001D9D556A|nr:MULTISPECIES: PEP-CTERM sorting domain-containing protein [unclassified Microcoleus]TAF57713.1 MAG: PEP-CTERM sorting domain-containing protein [Oscillatoriales cyanobacterium]MCC3410090.1 PEP-CTERM sorting domain-containing protein [Microcoleus sp. PH2017_10_PVI_O_A]MCC3464352.1 PEP-CTERM sorting domain-containing protein [Microcoleus sp. PH2017_11_PCY_U_A]MCC3481812.1 PEP-CTERM sorting domain-containing protein [Microcoleus sp. PH2017_12_PCY_D_A]MCC3563673.1 PEP-CTERM sorting domain-conta